MELSNTVTAETMANWLCFDVRNYIDSIRFESELLLNNATSLESLRNRMAALSLYCETVLIYGELQKNELSSGGISITSLLYDVTDQLKPIADEFDCVVETRYSHTNNLAFANREVVRLATTVLGFELIRVMSQKGEQENTRLVVRMGKKEGRVTLGVYAATQISPKKILKALRNITPIKNPVGFFSTGYPTGVLFVKEMLERAGLMLEPARYGRLSGFIFCLPESEQLSLF